ncbi:ATP-binding cassette subfamily C protein [Cellulosimicrobium cellulans]|jgi:ATP-binding cassette subfamily C protein|uniref:ABC transporter ATP-binding protein n=1 Tax=Cellulosimicrobium cellulans TaxID=1710 RepID=A0A1Y0HQX5_CELCE|nr:MULTISPECIES: ABC transporter ATP-binding protein [Cellulosimicrobium]ARU50521.1 ABC transporter ATP-binding protein [Cellulosimicrobium cellulans]MBM7820869.1 ATP-binding cassette subfamily C protein [Cellulosimicrobium cellulans]
MKRLLDQYRSISPYLPRSAQRFLIIFSIGSAFLSVLDVVALMLLSSVLAAAVTGGDFTIPLIGTIPISSVPALIVVLSGVVLLKSAMGVALQWKATRHFAGFELSVGDHLFRSYIHSPWTERINISTPRVIQLTDGGVSSVVGGLLLPLTTVPGLLVTAVGVVVIIFLQQPFTAAITLAYLGGIGVLQYYVLGRRTRVAARVARDSSLKVAGLLTGMMAALKEITLREKEDEVAQAVATTRARTSRARSNLYFLRAVPRFVLDAAVIGGFVLTGGVGFAVGGMTEAVSALALFGIAGFRLVPSITSFQSIVTSSVSADPYIRTIIGDIERSRERATANPEDDDAGPALPSSLAIEMRDVSYTYPTGTEPALRDVELTIPFGSTVGIVGASGAGKSTLVDILLGLLEPSGGTVSFGGGAHAQRPSEWRRHVGYVPQAVALFDGSIAQNVALTWGGDFDRDRVERALRRAQLWDAVTARSRGIDERIGEGGLALSGGQRQRLGIARALYSDPLVVVLDEATSALDTKTEADVAAAINELAGEITVISVAHRLSTIRDADQILYMESGEIVASGTFDDVVAVSPAFHQQASLAGLV